MQDDLGNSGHKPANRRGNYAADDLKKLGYKQEMTRSRGLSHILFMTLAIMAVPYGLAAPIATSLAAGGPATILWGWVAVSFLTIPLACSLGEICAKYPTSAGAYYWCFRLATPRRRLLLSWINGWLTMAGVWTISLSVTFGTSQLIVAGTGIYLPNWVVKPWHTYLIFLAVTAVTVIFCVFFNALLPQIDIVSAYWTLLGIVVILVCVSVKAAAGRHSAAFALGHFDPAPSGWTPGWAFFIGLLPAYTFSAIGMIASMAEEVHNPSSDLPRAIVWSIPIGFMSGVLFLVPILFTLPDIAALISGALRVGGTRHLDHLYFLCLVSSGQPVGLMFELIMGSKGGGFGLWFIIFGVGMFCAISISCAASRATWAFARDAAIPFHLTFAKVNTHLSGGIPLNAILLSTAIQVFLGLIYLGSSAAFNAFVGVAVMCLGASYSMPVAISLVNGRKDMADSPFHLGRAGTVLNAIAVVWAMFEIVLFSMPAVLPVTPTTMNYASVVFVAFGLMSAVWYMISGRFHYKGPEIPEGDQSEGQEAQVGDKQEAKQQI
ncbi:amino acid transporter [Mycena galericulata]|nr:amino acid transporter [Mycena galericulata]